MPTSIPRLMPSILHLAIRRKSNPASLSRPFHRTSLHLYAMSFSSHYRSLSPFFSLPNHSPPFYCPLFSPSAFSFSSRLSLFTIAFLLIATPFVQFFCSLGGLFHPFQFSLSCSPHVHIHTHTASLSLSLSLWNCLQERDLSDLP